MKEALARASEADYPLRAIEVYCERIDQLIEGGGNPAYAEAVKTIAHMARLRTVQAQAAHVAALKARFGAGATS